jgi:MoxR-like ATPase
MAGRPNVAAEDMWRIAAQCLRHRLVLGYEAIADGVSADSLIEDVLESHPTPSVEG